LNIWICSGFRSYAYQQNLYNRYVARDGKAEADRYSARPGHSEHQTGLAMDVNSVGQSFAYTSEGKWLAAHAHEYGFIIRYPKGKEDITGYMYEPWHIRYVGVEIAKEITEAGITFEEYMGVA
jgi:D-alanyl-D-alanine carboxypeptidase